MIRGQDGHDNADGGDGKDSLSGDGGNDTLKGGNDDDRVLGGEGNDLLAGNDGNDDIRGENGHDTLTGGTGNDTLSGGDGYDEIHGDADNNNITGGNGDDLILAGDGHDTIKGEYGYDTITGGGGNDIIYGDALNDLLFGKDGADTIDGGIGQDEIYGGNGNDNLLGGENNDTIFGEAGNDKIDGNNSNDKLSGGDGNDTVYGGSGFDEVHGAAGNDIILGHSGSDMLMGGDGNDQLDGGLDNDTLIGNEGADTLTGGRGKDLLYGGGDKAIFDGTFGALIHAHDGFGYDSGWHAQLHERKLGDVNGDGRADIIGFGGKQIIIALGNEDGSFGEVSSISHEMANQSGFWRGRDVADVNGDGLADLIGFSRSTTFVSLARRDGTFTASTVASKGFGYNDGWRVEEHERKLADVNGDGRADIVGFGDDGVYVAFGQENGEFLRDFKATDQMSSVNGNWSVLLHERDVADVNGDGLADLIGFGDSNVQVALSNGDGSFTKAKSVHYNFDRNSNWRVEEHERKLADINGDGRADIVGFGAITYIAFGQEDGKFSNAYQATALLGSRSGEWNPQLHERDVADINGDGLADLIGFGASGVKVTLATGVGEVGGFTDSFVFNSIHETGVGRADRDEIHNFETGLDHIDLRAIDANTKINGNQAFSFNGTTAIANAIWYEAIGDNLIIRGDINGNARADFEIEIIGSNSINGNDFLL